MNPHLQRALMLLEQSRHEMAEDELRRALIQNPDDAMPHAVLAICLGEREKYVEASQEAENAIHLAPDLPYVHFAHSIVLQKRNHFPEAQAAIEEAIGRDPDQPDYFAQLAQLQFVQRRWQNALDAAEQGLELDPEDVACTNLRAMALVKLGKNIEAGEAISTALKQAPEDAYTHANMGWSLLEQEQPEKAMEHFREALRLDPELEWARVGIIEAMKARYFIYRIMLNWFLWMMKLSGRAQWGVIVGAYVGYQVLRSVAGNHPNLQPWIMPLLVAYIAFAIMTWVASPLFNLLLRLNRFGRLALSDKQVTTSNWVGLCVVSALSFLVAYFTTGVDEFLYAALASGLLIPPLSHIYHCSAGWPRAAIILATLALGELALVIICSTVAASLLPAALSGTARGLANLAFLPFVLSAVAMQFGVNALVSAVPRRGTQSARLVWIFGGIALGLGTLFILGFIALAALSALTRSHDPTVFNTPIRDYEVARYDFER